MVFLYVGDGEGVHVVLSNARKMAAELENCFAFTLVVLSPP